jgi:hypothetical protein
MPDIVLRQGAASPTDVVLFSASASVVLVGASCSQSAASSTGVIGQGHTLSGAATGQNATSATGAVLQAHALTGSACIQSGTAGVGAVAQAHFLLGTDSSQSATSNVGAASQTQVLAGADCNQFSTSGVGAISGGLTPPVSARDLTPSGGSSTALSMSEFVAKFAKKEKFANHVSGSANQPSAHLRRQQDEEALLACIF